MNELSTRKERREPGKGAAIEKKEFLVKNTKYTKKQSYLRGFPGGASGKELSCSLRRPRRPGFDPWVGKIPGLGRSPGEGNGYPLQYSGLENSMDCSLPGSSVHGDSPGKNTGLGCHALLQGIFPTQGSSQPTDQTQVSQQTTARASERTICN